MAFIQDQFVCSQTPNRIAIINIIVDLLLIFVDKSDELASGGKHD